MSWAVIMPRTLLLLFSTLPCLLALRPASAAGAPLISASFDAAAALFALRDSYASVNVDSGSLHENFDFADPVLTALTANLARAAPTQLRVGGGAADNVLFTGRGGARGACSPPPDEANSTFGVDVCVDAAYFTQLCTFAARAGVGLVWDLNAALRDWRDGGVLGPWNSTNAEALFSFLVGPDKPPECPIGSLHRPDPPNRSLRPTAPTNFQ